MQKVEASKMASMTLQEKARWQQHWQVERGDPVKTFKGAKFRLSHERGEKGGAD